MIGRKADIIHHSYELQKKMEEADGYWGDALERDVLMENEGYEELHQALYQECWDIMMKEVEEGWYKHVEGILGDGHFTEKIYVEELGMIMRADGESMDEYQGYILRFGTDPFSTLICWVKLPDDEPVEKSFGFVGGADAIILLRDMVDRDKFY